MQGIKDTLELTIIIYFSAAEIFYKLINLIHEQTGDLLPSAYLEVISRAADDKNRRYAKIFIQTANLKAQKRLYCVNTGVFLASKCDGIDFSSKLSSFVYHV